ncbi:MULTISPECIES: FMN-dependent NADH-azoreductase [unclassified Sphingomonas]|uniref:FMN-dependent NADH-azoreductase n=1 Tax=unclassified Sphingomonas TaxID=196159 RepID=UPI0006F53A7F|nr:MULTISPECIES: NAD(P)H-dependent oxidoreductase [unclassified Sphingomonas]KQX17486.1 NAD(P)H dehydrogenase [Sphingomonas sp. Root1294]KQY70412.1 NAD(P)H dehydrogenase [Sphingomonas sp. Root50]KRB92102.1 NAD(P)H dehydrogenase [Sphingomonas sp. Root720]
MARLLHIDASPRGPRSRSNMVADRLIAGLTGHDIERLALFDADLPAFDGAAIEGRYALVAGEPVDGAVRADWADIERRIAHFLSFDGWILTVPMWNFGIPYRLKHYIDLITQPGMAFRVVDGQGEGLAAGRKAILVASGALDIRPDGPMAAYDFQIAYLEAWLGFIGVTDIDTLHVRPTYGDAAGVEAAMARAYADADALLARLSLPSRV